MNESFVRGLRLLEYPEADDAYAELSPGMFSRSNQRGMESVLHHCFSVCGVAGDAYPWPLCLPAQKGEFLKAACAALSDMERAGSIPLGTFRKSLLRTCSSDRFVSLVFHVVTHAVRCSVARASGQEPPRVPLGASGRRVCRSYARMEERRFAGLAARSVACDKAWQAAADESLAAYREATGENAAPQAGAAPGVDARQELDVCRELIARLEAQDASPLAGQPRDVAAADAVELSRRWRRVLLALSNERIADPPADIDAKTDVPQASARLASTLADVEASVLRLRSRASRPETSLAMQLVPPTPAAKRVLGEAVTPLPPPQFDSDSDGEADDENVLDAVRRRVFDGDDSDDEVFFGSVTAKEAVASTRA